VTRREEIVAYARQMGWRPTGVNRPEDLHLYAIDDPKQHLAVHFKVASGHIDLAIGMDEKGTVEKITGGVREVKRFLRERRHRR